MHNTLKIPFHRASIGEKEIDEVVHTLRSGWLTTGPKTKQFEAEFAASVGARHAVALNSATAALHLALEATGLKRGHSVLVPTMTFAATAEVVRYFDAKPILVDCCPKTFNLDIMDARRKAEIAVGRSELLHAIIPVHYGGLVADMAGVRQLARDFNLKVIEDAAHCCPAHYRDGPGAPWKSVGSESDICCYSFYANKCITTGEGGMACTNDDALAERMRIMGLHGISKDAWKRFTSEGSWYYEIIAPGFKYNLTDIASSIGLWQLRRAEEFRRERERVAQAYRKLLAAIPEVIAPPAPADRIHSWHLFAVRLRLDRLTIDRAAVINDLKKAGIGTSVHWMPLHLHPYYRQFAPSNPCDFPVSTALFPELVSLPIFPEMTDGDVEFVASELAGICRTHRR
jgi:dTDP-4-amino-4,6-dideoxygalactose transaminase